MPDVCEADLSEGELTCRSNEKVFMSKDSGNGKSLEKRAGGGM